MRSGVNCGISALVLFAWVAVIGCGGSSKPTVPPAAAYTVGGSVKGVTGTGLVLQNNGGSSLAVSATATSFAFPAPVTEGTVYSVTVLTAPAGESCAVANGAGRATANVTNVSVSCTSNYSIGGSITGLTGSGLVLQDNGGDDLPVAAGATNFTFPSPLLAGSAYSVAVLAQPVGENCVVASGTGTANANVTSAAIACTQLYAVGGTVIGLHAQGLILQDNGADDLAVAPEANSFSFTTALAAGSIFSVTVAKQPAGESCTVSNGGGTVSAATPVKVVCVGEWSWTGGSDTVGLNGGVAGVPGVLGTPSPTNTPGGREQADIWKDAAGNTWVFGGYGYDATGTGGQLNDLWKFDPTQGSNGEWTWMSGSSTAPLAISPGFPRGQPGTYGTLGQASPINAPGGREQAVTWIDGSGNFWLFGGIGIDSVGMYGYLNDLWEFQPALGTHGEWAWMGGSSTAPPSASPTGQPGKYGQLGVPSGANIPGSRYGAYAWTDASGHFWLFGGNGFDSVSTNGYLNDLWEFTPGINGVPGKWTWIAGPSTLPPSPAPWIQSAEPGVYGILGTPDGANTPGGRSAGVAWADVSGNLWLFGGLGADSAGNSGFLNDLWKYTPSTNGSAGEWTWMTGSKILGDNGGQPGIYGLLGVSDPANTPGARFSSASWIDTAGNLWLFGGQGYDWVSSSRFLNDLWKYTPSADGSPGQWMWMGGSNLIPPSPVFGVQSGQPGVYGTFGAPGPANTPGARIGGVPWVDADGNLRLFGGQGYDGTGAQGYLNDSWTYQP